MRTSWIILVREDERTDPHKLLILRRCDESTLTGVLFYRYYSFKLTGRLIRKREMEHFLFVRPGSIGIVPTVIIIEGSVYMANPFALAWNIRLC